MRTLPLTWTAALLATTSIVAVTSAHAGGFAVREQSTTTQGSSFAGAASHESLSSMYWNPAGVTHQSGTNTESHYAYIIGRSEVTAENYTVEPGPAPGLGGFNPGTQVTTLGGGNAFDPNPGAEQNNSGNIAKQTVVPASYANMQMSDQLFVGVSINNPFGLVTEPSNPQYYGSVLARTSDIFNPVATPTIGYKIMPGIAVAAGLQVGYLEGTLKFGAAGGNNVYYNGDDFGFGFTLGTTITPAAGTRIGIGYRSEMNYTLDGKFADNNDGSQFSAEVDITTPDVFTVSLHQALTDQTRFMATYEWTQWSDFNRLDIVAQQDGVAPVSLQPNPVFPGLNTLPTQGTSVAGQTFASLVTDWDDAWFASVGLEHDHTDYLTFRAGIAYEESPIARPDQRITGVPDNDRIWVSGGLTIDAGNSIPNPLATFMGTESTTKIDLAYTHIFVENGEIERELISSENITFHGRAEQSVDIISVGLRTKFGPSHSPLK
ncbi:MAG: outer membrane protein transport protein [Pseudomonadota bacterium]